MLDACTVCCDGLKGLPEAINTIWPEAIVQTCVVHLVCNSLRLSSRKHWQHLVIGMRQIYTAPTLEAATDSFADFTEAWEPVYPALIASWRAAWEELIPFLSFPGAGAETDLHEKRDRVIERPIPGHDPAPGQFPR